MINCNCRCVAFLMSSIALLGSPALLAAQDSSSRDEARVEEGTSVYRTVDEHGHAVFSDKGTTGAEKIKIRETMTFPAAALKKPTSRFPYDGVRSGANKVAYKYHTLEITQPQDDVAIRSNSGSLTVEPYISPALYPNHLLQLVMDQEVYATNQGGAFQLVNLDRGVHILHLQIVDAKGEQVIKASDPISISILRPSSLHPGRKKS